MIYDLNKIVRYAAADGEIRPTPQRACITIVDGVIAGEGNGPLQSLPVEAGLVLAGHDPFQVDMVMARLMGFDYRKIPALRHHRAFEDADWGNFSSHELHIDNNGTVLHGIAELPVLRKFLAPPGWASHIELGDEDGKGTMAAVRVL